MGSLLFGKEGVLFIHSEDMDPAVSIDQLCHFSGLNRSTFPHHVVAGMTNCNDSKGVGAVCKKKSDGSQITGNRGMLPQTRLVVNVQTSTAETFGVEYPGCIKAIPCD